MQKREEKNKTEMWMNEMYKAQRKYEIDRGEEEEALGL
jgi:hypothetical protein